MLASLFTRLFGARQAASARRLVGAQRRPTPATCLLSLEVLEDRTVPSGGPGPSSLVSGSGGPGPSALVSTSGSNASGSTPGGSSQTSQQTQVLVNYLNQALSKLVPGGPAYPLPPTIGPTQSGDLLAPSDVAALPVAMQQSAVAVIPLTLYGADVSAVLTVPPPPGYSSSLVTVTSGKDASVFLVVTAMSTASAAGSTSGGGPAVPC
jgi:hypothetical protein